MTVWIAGGTRVIQGHQKHTKYHFGAESDADGRFHTFNGVVSESGKKAEGTLGAEGGTSEGLPCGNLSTNWEAKK